MLRDGPARLIIFASSLAQPVSGKARAAASHGRSTMTGGGGIFKENFAGKKGVQSQGMHLRAPFFDKVIKHFVIKPSPNAQCSYTFWRQVKKLACELTILNLILLMVKIPHILEGLRYTPS